MFFHHKCFVVTEQQQLRNLFLYRCVYCAVFKRLCSSMSEWIKKTRNNRHKRSPNILIHSNKGNKYKAYVNVHFDIYKKLVIIARMDSVGGKMLVFDKDILKRSIYLVSAQDKEYIEDKYRKLHYNQNTSLINKLVIIHLHQTDTLGYYRQIASLVMDKEAEIRSQIEQQLPQEYEHFRRLKQSGFKYSIADTLSFRNELLALFEYQASFDNINR